LSQERTQPHRSFKAAFTAWLGGMILKLLGLTWRFRIVDPEGLLKDRNSSAVFIYTLWHNRILCMPVFVRRHVRHRPMCVLTSASRDGAVLSGVVARFGFSAVRGSSSRRGAQALTELVDVLKSGSDVVITPDGPRGPCYDFAPGAVKLAQLTGCPIVALRVTYSRAWRLKTWDKFYFPKPFSRVEVELLPRVLVDAGLEGDAFDAVSQQLKTAMGGDSDSSR
jgi:lysophospholipid acyltransferase (LPLAT)-like uncharacterized protein